MARDSAFRFFFFTSISFSSFLRDHARTFGRHEPAKLDPGVFADIMNRPVHSLDGTELSPIEDRGPAFRKSRLWITPWPGRNFLNFIFTGPGFTKVAKGALLGKIEALARRRRPSPVQVREVGGTPQCCHRISQERFSFFVFPSRCAPPFARSAHTQDIGSPKPGRVALRRLTTPH